MDSLTLLFTICIGAGSVLGYRVHLNVSDDMPSAGSTQVVLTCSYNVLAPSELRKVYIDKYGSQHTGWKTIAVMNKDETPQFIDGGADLADRATLTTGDNSMVLTFTSVTCDDTGRYKCDITESMDREIGDIGEKPLNVQERGETCGGAPHIAFSLPTVLFLLFFAFVLSR